MAANAGTYEITTSNGQVHTQRLAPDGTFTLTSAGSQPQTGTWRTAGNQLCLTLQGATESCYTGSQPGPDGTFTMNGAGMLNGATVRKTAAS